MKQKHTQAKKARRLNFHFYYQGGVWTLSVHDRRVLGIYGSDAREFDVKHPSLENAVEGTRQMREKQKRELLRKSSRHQ